MPVRGQGDKTRGARPAAAGPSPGAPRTLSPARRARVTLAAVETAEEFDMALQNHLSELERKHQAVAREVEVAATHPATDDIALHKLKRRKLQIKDEMSRLRTERPGA